MEKHTNQIHKKMEDFRQSYKAGNIEDAMNLALEIDNEIYKKGIDTLALYDMAQLKGGQTKMDHKKYGQGTSFYVEVANPLIGDRTIPMNCDEWMKQVDLNAQMYGLEKTWTSQNANPRDKPNCAYFTKDQRDAELARNDLKAKGLAEHIAILKLEEGEAKTPL